MKLTKLLNEGKLNELNPKLNKKVKSYMDAYLKGIPAGSPEFHHSVMMVLKGALTDANFHSEAKKLDSLFPKAKKSKYYDNSNMNDVMEDKGVDIAGWAKWDGHDILDAFSYYTNMTIGGGTGGKLESLKESISELMESETLAESSYPSKLTEGKFKVDDLVYNKRTKTVGIVRMGDDKYGEVKTDADGNVNVDELEKYNPIKNKHQNNAKVAPSTEKEVSKRGLFNPFKNESVMNEAKYDIGMARKGNGLTIYNKAEEEKGDYKNIAHIDNKGNIKLYDKKLPTNIKKMIEKEAEKLKESVNEEAITYGIEYKSSKNDRKFKKASLTKTTHNPNIDNMMIKAISKDAKSLAKQDGWVDYRITKDGVPVNESINEGTKMIKLKNLLNESKVSDAWKKNNKRGKILKVGNVTLKSDGPGGIHSISKNGKKWGTFELDGNDWMVKPTYGKENWVDSIDNVIKIVNESKSMKLTDMLNESIGIGELPSSKLMKMKVPAKDMLKSVNEAKFKKVTKQMWAKMDYDERVNALLTFFKDPDDAEEYGDSEWNNIPSGADSGMYIFV